MDNKDIQTDIECGEEIIEALAELLADLDALIAKEGE